MHDTDSGIPCSLWERLFEDTPDRMRSHGQRVREYRRNVMDDVQNLLNTRVAGPPVPSSYPHVLRSLRMYGLPDVTAMSLRSTTDQNYLRQEIETALLKFEPRLSAVSVSVEPEENNSLKLRFRVQALLRMDPEPELISFETLLERESARFIVERERG